MLSNLLIIVSKLEITEKIQQKQTPTPRPQSRALVDTVDHQNHHGTTQSIDLPDWDRTHDLFKLHEKCDRACVSDRETSMNTQATLSEYRHMNSLLIPLLRGWLRQKNLLGEDTTMCRITYMAPCGRSLTSVSELQRYLLVDTHSHLQVDMFTFEREVRLDRYFVTAPSSFVITDDITKGREKRAAISCVNTVDRSKPDPKVSYMAQFSSPLVDSLQQDQLDCCACKNNCEDVEKCACWLRTRDSASHLASSLGHDQVKSNRRLIQIVLPMHLHW